MDEVSGLAAALSFSECAQTDLKEDEVEEESEYSASMKGDWRTRGRTGNERTSISKRKSKSLGLSLSNFVLGDTIADGSDATIVAARTLRGTAARKNIFDKEVVLKSIPKYRVSDKVRQHLHREIEIHLRVGSHPNITTLHASFEDDHGIYLVIERLYGPTLHQVIRKYGVLSEKFALQIIDQLLEAICYMHSRGFSHRDISSKNTMFREWPSSSNGKFHVMLVDMGHACYRDPEEIVHGFSSEKIGTLYFRAPEVTRDPTYRPESCDMWSIGVLLYMMLSGNYPYRGETAKEIVQVVHKSRLSFEGKRWDGITSGTKAIIRSLLRPMPFMRPNAERLKREVHGVLQGKPLPVLFEMGDPVEEQHPVGTKSVKSSPCKSEGG